MNVSGQDLKVKVSKYMSYLLRHNSENLRMDDHGFVVLDELLAKVRERFRIDKSLIIKIVEDCDRTRFEIVDNKVRALYGHTMSVQQELEEDMVGKMFFHSTTLGAAYKILIVGLKPMKRRWVHLSPTLEIAVDVGLRRTKQPVILEVNAEEARKEGVKFYKATDKVYLCASIPPNLIKRVRISGNIQ